MKLSEFSYLKPGDTIYVVAQRSDNPQQTPSFFVEERKVFEIHIRREGSQIVTIVNGEISYVPEEYVFLSKNEITDLILRNQDNLVCSRCGKIDLKEKIYDVGGVNLCKQCASEVSHFIEQFVFPRRIDPVVVTPVAAPEFTPSVVQEPVEEPVQEVVEEAVFDGGGAFETKPKASKSRKR